MADRDKELLAALIAAAIFGGPGGPKPKPEDFPFVGKVNGKPFIGGFDVADMKTYLLRHMDEQPLPKDHASQHAEIIFNHPEKGEQKVFEVTLHYLT